MTIRQRILKAIYPLFLYYKSKNTGKKVLTNDQLTRPNVSFYSLSTPLNGGTILPFEKLKGKKVLLVNTASDCGYTPQYEALQKLQEQFINQLVIIAFPSNDFQQQEKGTDGDIAVFCKTNYGINFPIAKKCIVRGSDKNNVYKFLSESKFNGWNDQEPTWNFAKYLVDENGILLNYFDPSVSPLDSILISALKE
ncbi:MAG TPA: glutathione peroxidase [Flavisolibacter sp.]|nr:glutathione peroxidase [Flavisolibacter sp.]